jgi:hypothetical protein
LKEDKRHLKETIDKQKKRDHEEANLLTKERERRQSYLAKEQAIEKAAESRITERAKKRSNEEKEQQALALARKQIYDANEKKRDEAHKARKLQDNA